jgi:hypothetical protein
VLAQVVRGLQAAAGRDGLDRQVAGLQQALGQPGALAQDPLVRGRAGDGHELAGEGARAHGRPSRQVVHGHRLVQVLLQPGHRVVQQAVGHRHGLVDVLGLAAVALRRHHQVAGQPGGDLAAVVAPHHVQAQVEAGRAARRGEQVAVVDVQHVGVDADVRVPAGQVGALRPVRGGPAPVQQARGGQDQRAGAQRDDAPALRAGLAQRGEHRAWHQVGGVGRQHDDGPGGAQRGQPARHLDLEARVDRHGRGDPADRQPVPGHAESLRVAGAEDVAGHAELEQGDPLVDHDGDVTSPPG